MTDGIYNDFASFKNQLPDELLDDRKIRGDRPIDAFITDEKGKRRRINRAMIYAFVHNGDPFIATHSGYYPLFKKK